ncbi:MAG: hypothetical protein JSS98_09855 [Bacteroidetes bacterium]|nr:hypothetical protein [Bacteroidota bacterium]
MYSILIDIIGYSASALLAISLMVNNDLKFRWVNAGGCLFFIIYGGFIGAWPIIVTNSLLLAINIFYLLKIYTSHEDFELIEFQGTERLVKKFLTFYAADIHNYFPDFKHEINEDQLNFVILRDLVIANIFIATLQPDGSAIIRLNYTVSKYRDYKVGTFIFKKDRKFLISKKINELVYESVANKNHLHFLKKMGFMQSEINKSSYFLKLS